jgi:hypothetical protein
MVKLYYHHVGQRGSSDFQKTVFRDVEISVLQTIPDAATRNNITEEIQVLFPSGRFNCWGVPAGAGPVIKNLSKNDYVLLIENTRIIGLIPALCHVKYYLASQQPALSKVLWGDDKFPYIFFFDTERLDLAWIDFIDQLNYREQYNPRGQFLAVADEKVEKFGGVEGYIRYIREEFSKDTPLFANVTAQELQGEAQPIDRGKQEVDNLEPDQVNEELSKLCNVTLKEDDPALTQEPQTNVHAVKARDAAFAIVVKRLYGNRCAVCSAGALGPKGETEVEAAHIYPKGLDGSDDPRNGICLCRRHHWAFDVGWFAISDDYTVLIHKNLPKEADYDFVQMWENQRIHLPQNKEFEPHLKFVRARRNLMSFL